MSNKPSEELSLNEIDTLIVKMRKLWHNGSIEIYNFNKDSYYFMLIYDNSFQRICLIVSILDKKKGFFNTYDDVKIHLRIDEKNGSSNFRFEDYLPENNGQVKLLKDFHREIRGQAHNSREMLEKFLYD